MTEKTFAPVNSSWIEGARYDPTARVLTVKLKSGKEYTHHDLPAEKHAAFMESASPGRYYSEKIKNNH